MVVVTDAVVARCYSDMRLPEPLYGRTSPRIGAGLQQLSLRSSIALECVLWRSERRCGAGRAEAASGRRPVVVDAGGVDGDDPPRGVVEVPAPPRVRLCAGRAAAGEPG
jgi:hypothetical protein